MRSVHLYLSLAPEALIASMLTPEEFGVYYAVGSAKRSRGQAIFFEVDPGFRHPEFRVEEGIRRCVPHEDGSPKASIYISVYRVLERVPLDLIFRLYLVTKDGRTLGLDASIELPEETEELHLYQEIAPVHPLVVKTPTSLLSLPVICFVELRLGELAHDPLHGVVRDLPYSNLEHLRDCLIDLKTKTVHAKMVDRVHPAAFPYRMIKSGVFLGNEERLVVYPMLSQEELRARFHPWWRSAYM